MAHAEEWKIHDDENFITLTKNGEIQHGNNFYFNFKETPLISTLISAPKLGSKLRKTVFKGMRK